VSGEKKMPEHFEEKVKEFFRLIFSYSPKLEIMLLSETEYIEFFRGRGPENTVGRTVPSVDDEVKHLIFIKIPPQEKNIPINTLMHEILHVYFPNLEEETIKKAAETFTLAICCYLAVYDSQPVRALFIELCCFEDGLRKLAGLPKFDPVTMTEYEKLRGRNRH
jgi:hypothetical protein